MEKKSANGLNPVKWSKHVEERKEKKDKRYKQFQKLY